MTYDELFEIGMKNAESAGTLAAWMNHLKRAAGLESHNEQHDDLLAWITRTKAEAQDLRETLNEIKDAAGCNDYDYMLAWIRERRARDGEDETERA